MYFQFSVHKLEQRRNRTASRGNGRNPFLIQLNIN